MSKKPYFESHKPIRTEAAAAGFKRVWFEVAQDEVQMIKVPSGLSASEITEKCVAKLQELKDRRVLEDELEALEAQAEALRQQLGQ
jgi:ABC-type iron transport system FetAB ATPase subunit